MGKRSISSYFKKSDVSSSSSQRSDLSEEEEETMKEAKRARSSDSGNQASSAEISSEATCQRSSIMSEDIGNYIADGGLSKLSNAEKISCSIHIGNHRQPTHWVQSILRVKSAF